MDVGIAPFTFTTNDPLVDAVLPVPTNLGLIGLRLVVLVIKGIAFLLRDTARVPLNHRL